MNNYAASDINAHSRTNALLAFGYVNLYLIYISIFICLDLMTNSKKYIFWQECRAG